MWSWLCMWSHWRRFTISHGYWGSGGSTSSQRINTPKLLIPSAELSGSVNPSTGLSAELFPGQPAPLWKSPPGYLAQWCQRGECLPDTPPSQDDVQGEMHTVFAQETSGWSASPQAGHWLFYKLVEQNRMGRHWAPVITQPPQQVRNENEMLGNGLPGRSSPETQHHCCTVTFPSL